MDFESQEDIVSCILKTLILDYLEKIVNNINVEIIPNLFDNLSLMNKSDKKIDFQNFFGFFQHLGKITEIPCVELFEKFRDKDFLDRIDLNNLKKYISEKAKCAIYRQSFMSYIPHYEWDNMYSENLTEWLVSMLSKSSKLSNWNSENIKFYSLMVAEKIIFFAGSKEKNMVKIVDLLNSQIFKELRMLFTENDSQSELGIEWFVEVTNEFVEMQNENHVVEKEKFSSYNNDDINPRFVIELFSNFKNENMVLSEFFTFHTAYNNIEHLNGARYFFNIFTGSAKNYIDRKDLRYYLRGVCDVISFYNPASSVEQLVNEFHDMVHPKVDGEIYLEDLIYCGHTKLFIKSLISVTAFNDEENVEDVGDYVTGTPVNL